VSGDIDLTDSSGALQVSSTSGDVQMSGDFTGSKLETVSGEITLDGASGPLRARTISGNIKLSDLRDAQLDLESTSGDIEVGGTLAARLSSTISNISGDVQVRLGELSDLKLSATTVSGDLSSDLDLREAQRERRSLSGTLGLGQTTLTISTTSGDVEVDEE
jgi:DUF4097 and DUF4098 domain-containing protein YvlB